MSAHTPTLPGPHDITRRELPNGVVVLVRENHHAPSVVVSGSLMAGSLFEAPETNGLAAFTAAMLLRGTQTRDFAAIHETLESNGASLNFSAGRHTVGFSGKSLAEDLPMLADMLADALRRPTFPPEYVERVRGQLVTGLKAREQHTRHVAARLFRELLYPAEHPYHYLPSGQVETVQPLTRAQIADFHRTHYGPRGMFVVVVGAVETEAAIAQIEQALGDWQNAAQPEPPVLPPVPPLEGVRERTHVMRDKSQADLVLGVAGPPRNAPDWMAASLANNIFGVFGMYGRIGDVVREKGGMAYYSFSRLDGGLGPGPWRVIAGVNPANIEPAVAAIRGEIRRLTEEPVGEEELADNQSYFVGHLPLQLESNEGVAGAIATMERYGLGLDYLLRYADEVRAVTRDDVLEAARRYWHPDRYVLAIAGPEG